MEDDRRTLMNDDRSVGDRVLRHPHHHGNHRTDGGRRTRACGSDDQGCSDSWGEPTAGQRNGVVRQNSNANSNATPSEVDSRSEVGCLAASVSCWSCPHQVGEGNLLLRAPEALGPQGEM